MPSKIYNIQGKFIRISVENGSVTEIRFVDKFIDMDSQNELCDIAALQLGEYFEGKRKSFDLPLNPKGTAFQQKVWQELSRIPYAQTRSYKQIATLIGNPNASRAVGSANNRNPLHIVIPCHRVISSNGSLAGYAAGLENKQFLLHIEKLHSVVTSKS